MLRTFLVQLGSLTLTCFPFRDIRRILDTCPISACQYRLQWKISSGTSRVDNLFRLYLGLFGGDRLSPMVSTFVYSSHPSWFIFHLWFDTLIRHCLTYHCVFESCTIFVKIVSSNYHNQKSGNRNNSKNLCWSVCPFFCAVWKKLVDQNQDCRVSSIYKTSLWYWISKWDPDPD